MPLTIRIEPTYSVQERMMNHLRHALRNQRVLPVIPDADKAVFRARCYECNETTGWVPAGANFICDECKAEEAAERERENQPKEMIVRHVVEHVQSGQLDDSLIDQLH